LPFLTSLPCAARCPIRASIAMKRASGAQRAAELLGVSIG